MHSLCRPKARTVSKAEPLRLAVPPGTVVKSKKGALLGELLKSGQWLSGVDIHFCTGEILVPTLLLHEVHSHTSIQIPLTVC